MFWSERKRLSFLLQHKTFMTLRVLSSCPRRHDRQSRLAVSLMQSLDLTPASVTERLLQKK
jgi:hypothetical protein